MFFFIDTSEIMPILHEKNDSNSPFKKEKNILNYWNFSNGKKLLNTFLLNHFKSNWREIFFLIGIIT